MFKNVAKPPKAETITRIGKKELKIRYNMKRSTFLIP